MPRVVVPSRKVTVPVGVPVPEVGATAAFNARAAPALIVVAEAVRVVVVAVSGVELTMTVTAVEALARKLGLPPYEATIECVPAVFSSWLARVATPEALMGALPILAAPSKKTTVPAGALAEPAEEATVAVSVTGAPAVNGRGGCRQSRVGRSRQSRRRRRRHKHLNCGRAGQQQLRRLLAVETSCAEMLAVDAQWEIRGSRRIEGSIAVARHQVRRRSAKYDVELAVEVRIEYGNSRGRVVGADSRLTGLEGAVSRCRAKQ